MANHTQHTPNTSFDLTTNEPTGFPPRHIDGQCAHRWSSPQDPKRTFFYHQASRCQFFQQRGPPQTPPNFADPNVQGSGPPPTPPNLADSNRRHSALMTPTLIPSRNLHDQHPVIPSVTHERTLDSHLFDQTRQSVNPSISHQNSDVIPFTSFESPQALVQTPQNFNHRRFTHLSPEDDTFPALASQASNISRDNIFPGFLSDSGASHNNAIIAQEFSQNSLDNLPSQTADHRLLNHLRRESPSNYLGNQTSNTAGSDNSDDSDDSDEDGRDGMAWDQIDDADEHEAEEPTEVMHDLWLKFVVYSRQGVNPARGPTIAKNRAPKYYTHTFKARKFAIDVNNNSFADLKARLFELSDDMGKNSQGNSFIFKAADATNSVRVFAYLHAHEVYNKGAETEITCDEDLEDFFSAVLSYPKRVAGFDTLMEDPNKKKLEAERILSIGQHQLQAKNISNNVITTNSDLAHAAPEDPVDAALAALMLKYSTANNNNAEGWRVYKHDDVTKVMPMNFQLLGIWAEHMVKNPAVTVDIPPEVEGFEWTDLKRPVKMQTDVRGGKNDDHVDKEATKRSPIHPGTISEAQGYNLVIDPYEVDRIRTHANMEEYMAFAGVRVGKIDEACQLLLDHDIERFDAFLYPEETGLEDLIEMGIKRGTAMRLMNCAR
ncbi:uncharacterized protein MELLADRAFT_63736 [Melampsora larici-populina 98AG31]|uniref:Uncharacterized protein n=1 Tax=Melampsora larici-populina (strain 98AG31 / pathotype 3-4-7) TaxID=747676 RepID=F4RNZ2_MELLP|nr:uncharacterized protein MELLADRAFT_63736 [Melampsora larici-populina 98AG31]EGG05731.1 hypothetical protein MELLADRAFT_63736 [Melampsora larici-populina 98AG31]